jgi:HK97 family phage prohead protease
MVAKQFRNHVGTSLRLADPEQNGKTLVGRAIVWNSLSRDMGGFQERFLPGSVTDSVKGGIVCALLNHDTSKPLGTQQAGTLRLLEDAQGLNFEIDMPDTSYAADAIAMMKRGDGTGTSFAFNPIETNWTKENGLNIVEIRSATLGEVSPLVGVPAAYPATSCALRSLLDQGEIDYAERYGIDLDSVAAVFCAIKRGLPLDTKELATLKDARHLFSTVRKPALEGATARANELFLN